jgi:hypothetical protein
LRNDSIGDELRRVSTPEIRRLAKQRNIDIEGPEVRYVRAGARELVDRNNYLASDPLRVPVEPQLALHVLDDPIDHAGAEALTLGRLDGRPVGLRPADHKMPVSP